MKFIFGQSAFFQLFVFQNYSGELIPFCIPKFHPMMILLSKLVNFCSLPSLSSFLNILRFTYKRYRRAFPNVARHFDLDPNHSNVRLLRKGHREEECHGRQILRPVYFDSKSVSPTRTRQVAQKLIYIPSRNSSKISRHNWFHKIWLSNLTIKLLPGRKWNQFMRKLSEEAEWCWIKQPKHWAPSYNDAGCGGCSRKIYIKRRATEVA